MQANATRSPLWKGLAIAAVAPLLLAVLSTSASARDSLDLEGDCPFGDTKVVIFDGPEGQIYRCDPPPPPTGGGNGGGHGGHGGNGSGDGDSGGVLDPPEEDPFKDLDLGPGMPDDEFEDWVCKQFQVCGGPTLVA